MADFKRPNNKHRTIIMTPYVIKRWANAGATSKDQMNKHQTLITENVN